MTILSTTSIVCSAYTFDSILDCQTSCKVFFFFFLMLRCILYYIIVDTYVIGIVSFAQIPNTISVYTVNIRRARLIRFQWHLINVLSLLSVKNVLTDIFSYTLFDFLCLYLTTRALENVSVNLTNSIFKARHKLHLFLLGTYSNNWISQLALCLCKTG